MANQYLSQATTIFHTQEVSWRFTPDGEPRGYIQPQSLNELWFHTGTACNLSCPFCFEGSKPGDTRVETLTLSDVRHIMDEALSLGTSQFSFTGGEPFTNSAMVEILDYALDMNPCLVLSNATDPLHSRLNDIKPLRKKKHSLTFRVSLDYPDPEVHDTNRGEGCFNLSLNTMGKLHASGFKVSVARQRSNTQDSKAVDNAFIPFFRQVGLPDETHIISFPDLYPPCSNPQVPQITENCMTTCKTEAERRQFMCYYSKMVIKRNGKTRVYACTLVNDDDIYDLGETLTEAMRARVMLRHHRCFSCFSAGTTCSESGENSS